MVGVQQTLRCDNKDVSKKEIMVKNDIPYVVFGPLVFLLPLRKRLGTNREEGPHTVLCTTAKHCASLRVNRFTKSSLAQSCR